MSSKYQRRASLSARAILLPFTSYPLETVRHQHLPGERKTTDRTSRIYLRLDHRLARSFTSVALLALNATSKLVLMVVSNVSRLLLWLIALKASYKAQLILVG